MTGRYSPTQRLGIVPSVLLLLAIVLAPAGSQVTTNGGDRPVPGETVWTKWGAGQTALAEDGSDLWIAGAGSVVQRDKETGAMRRYGSLEGLHHFRIFAAAVDPSGNRWFGGDAGLSRLAPDGTWSHFNWRNSDLREETIFGIAIGADGALWLSHETRHDGAVSLRQPDGTILYFEDRRDAVVERYEQVRQTINANTLWAISGDDIWVGFQVYDGASWALRSPPSYPKALSAQMVLADGAGNVFYVNSRVGRWDGSGWWEYPGIYSATAIAMGPGGDAWVSWHDDSQVFLGRLPVEPGDVVDVRSLGHIGQATAMLLTAEGLWAVGTAYWSGKDAWLMQPGFEVTQFEDAPYVGHAVLAGDDLLFLYREQDSSSLRALDDGGTTVLDDDVWHTFDLTHIWYAEPLPGGDLWVTAYRDAAQNGSPWGPWRYHNGAWIQYELPVPAHGDFIARYIFAESDGATWFTYHSASLGEGGLLRLDDGGTPADLTDDVWSEHTGPMLPWALAVAPSGLVWAGNPEQGLWRYDGVTWEVYDRNTANVEIAIAADDTVYAIDRQNRVLIVRPDGTRDVRTVSRLIPAEFHRLVSSPDRSHLWTVASDDAVWYFGSSPEHLCCGLKRYDGATYIAYDTALNYYGNALEIDENHHVFVTVSGWFSGDLHRHSPLPEFSLDDQVWLLARDTLRRRTVPVHSVIGDRRTINLSLQDLPPGLNAVFSKNPIVAGGTTQLTLTADAGLAPGTYVATLVATDGVMTRTATHTIIIAPAVHDLYAPLAARP